MNNIDRRDIFPNAQVARYNLAAWHRDDGDTTVFIGREVAQAGEPGRPDSGILKLYETNEKGNLIQERVLWTPPVEGINLEDPRALVLEDNLVIGLTMVLTDINGNTIPFPAIARINSHRTWKEELPPILFVRTFGPGKNLTPIDSTTFLFRPDDPKYNHKLLVFSLHNQIPEKLSDIEFPTDLPWAKWRVGTTMSPIWINENEALFLIHGITIVQDEKTGNNKYIYSIGRAKLTRKDNIFSIKVAGEPILTPDDFVDENGQPIVEELHPNLRRVVYSCGGIIKKQKKDTLFLYVNVGDRTTFEVKFPLKQLTEGLF